LTKNIYFVHCLEVEFGVGFPVFAKSVQSFSIFLLVALSSSVKTWCNCFFYFDFLEKLVTFTRIQCDYKMVKVFWKSQSKIEKYEDPFNWNWVKFEEHEELIAMCNTKPRRVQVNTDKLSQILKNRKNNLLKWYHLNWGGLSWLLFQTLAIDKQKLVQHVNANPNFFSFKVSDKKT